VLLQESLVDLNRQLPAPLPMNRFRPNVVVSTGGPGWVDDTWAGLRNSEWRAFHNLLAAEGVAVGLVNAQPCSAKIAWWSA
jgi:hypothetical protein